MTDLNHVGIIGRLTRDAELVNVGQTVKADLSIAVNRSRKQADGSWTDETSFFDFTLWGKTAEGLKPFLTKGKQVAVEGHLKQDRWEKEGQKFSKVSIVAENVQLLGGNQKAVRAPEHLSLQQQLLPIIIFRATVEIFQKTFHSSEKINLKVFDGTLIK